MVVPRELVSQLLTKAHGKVVFLRFATISDKRQDSESGLPFGRRTSVYSVRRLSQSNLRRIATGWYRNQNCIVTALIFVVVGERAAQATSLNSHQRFG